MTNWRSLMLLWVSLMVIETIHAQASQYVDENVSQICDAIQCPPNKVCRVVRHCERPKCHPEFACLPCVPEGIDEQCNFMNFTHTVLFGDDQKPRELTPLDCDDGKKCPVGSTCARHMAFRDLGNCCYGTTPDRPVQNEDKKCVVCIPACGKGFRCEQVKDKCEGDFNSCQAIPKYGRCPSFRKRKCRLRSPRRCLHDQACPGLKKCCKTACEGYGCRYPIRE